MVYNALAVALVAAFVIMGLWRKPWKMEFFLANRQAGAGQVAGSILATCLGGSAVFGIVGKASQIGWPAFWWLGSGSLGLLLLALTWAKAMRRQPANITLPQWLGSEYGLPARWLSAMLIAIMWIGVISAQWVAAGALLSSLLGWPFAWGVALTAGAVVIYTGLGGQASVLRTDLAQALVIVAALFLVLLSLVWQTPTEELRASLPPWLGIETAVPVSLSWTEWLALTTVVGGMYLVGPDLYSRVMTGRNLRAARSGALTAAAVLLLCALLLTLLGVFVLQTGVVEARGAQALPWLIERLLPAVPAFLVQIFLLAALLSSADTCLLTAASVMELDLLSRQRSVRAAAGRARLLVVAIGILSATLAIASPRIIGNIMMAYAFYAGGLLVPLLLLRFSWAGRLVRRWVWVGMTGGGLLPLIALLDDWFDAPDFMLRQALAGMSGMVVCALFCILAWLTRHRVK